MCNVKTECKCDPKVVGHIHAELMKQYAEDARETDRPWKRWEFRSTNIGWMELSDHPSWGTAAKYRRKPRTHMVNGVEVPAPMRDAPANETKCWFSNPLNEGFADCLCWRNLPYQHTWLERGLLHTTKEAAVANAMAMIGRPAGRVRQKYRETYSTSTTERAY